MADRIHRFAELTSTNDEARRLADAGAAHGTVVQALRQTSGRGRLGRTWSSPPGNLYVSVVLRPPGSGLRHAELGFVAALAVVDAADAFLAAPGLAAPGLAAPGLAAPGRVSVKWPNDVLLDGAKLAGILLEGDAGTVVAGFGINIASAPVNARYPTTALALHAPATIEQTLSALRAALDHWWQTWLEQGFAPIRTAWLARGPQPDQPITMQLGTVQLHGRFAGLGENGALLLDTAEGPRRIVAGDVVA